jgi:signal transduction histidine kinase
MSEEWLADIFIPFHRGNIPTGHGEGVGLGLDLVKKITALHQGRILARNSEAGICFVLCLPSVPPVQG